MADHSHIDTDLTVEEVVALPFSPNIEADKLYFRTSDKLYFRPVRPKGRGDDGTQPTFDLPAGNNSARGLRITLARSIAAGDQGNGTVLIARPGNVTRVILDADSTPKDITIEFSANETMGDVKTAVDAVTGLSSAYYNSGVAGDTAAAATGEFSGGTPDYEFIPLPVVNGYVYEREALQRISGRQRPLIATTSTIPIANEPLGDAIDYTWTIESDADDLGIETDTGANVERLLLPSIAPEGWIGLMVEAYRSTDGVQGHAFIAWGGNYSFAGNENNNTGRTQVFTRNATSNQRITIHTRQRHPGQWQLLLVGAGTTQPSHLAIRVYAVVI